MVNNNIVINRSDLENARNEIPYVVTEFEDMLQFISNWVNIESNHILEINQSEKQLLQKIIDVEISKINIDCKEKSILYKLKNKLSE